MHKLSLAATALLVAVVPAVAQTANCNGPTAAQRFSNRAEFAASFYYNCGAHLFDLNVQVPIQLNSARTWLYDQGVGNPVVPSQVGNTAIVQVYTCPTTRLGNETNAPTNPGSVWTLLGQGTITVVDTGVGDGESPIVFNPPLSIPAGLYGVAFVYNAPTSGLNPGPLHCLGVNPNPGLPVSDHYITFSNDAIQGTAWTGVGTDSPNLRLLYTPAPNSAQVVPGGDGCYFRPHAWYENFPSPTVTADLSNTGFQMINLGPNYLVIPGASTIVPPTSVNLATLPTGSSSSANWDDALTTPITLPFTFNYPSGSTTDITISSNGFVFLAAVSNSTYGYCGASYGSIVPFRDNPARIAAYFHDLDPSVSGGLYYDVDPANQFVRITWNQVQEWGVPAAVNTMQITLHASGNVDVAYGSLSNQSSGNNAIVGFTPGNGSRLAPTIDITAALPFQSGDGNIPPVLSMDARPALGTAPNVVTSNITPGTQAQILIAGLNGLATPIDLTPFGMAGCYQHITPFATLLNLLNANGTFTQPFAIPNNVAFQSVQFFFQAAPLTPGLNGAGLLTSNGLCAKIGL